MSKSINNVGRNKKKYSIQSNMMFRIGSGFFLPKDFPIFFSFLCAEKKYKILLVKMCLLINHLRIFCFYFGVFSVCIFIFLKKIDYHRYIFIYFMMVRRERKNVMVVKWENAVKCISQLHLNDFFVGSFANGIHKKSTKCCIF